VEIQEIRKLKNGGMMIVFKSKEAAVWFKDSEIELTVLAEFNSTAVIKERTYQIMVPRVPTIFNLDDEQNLRELEEKNYITKDAIIKVRWIKPIYRHMMGQQFAHMIFTLKTPKDANILIRDRTFIMGAKSFPSKAKIEPKQCMKCRKWGHYAVQCLEAKNSCGNCAEDHHTNECPNPKHLFCISCKNNMHASWDRNCPKFHKRAAQIDENIPENMLKFFPTDENWTLRTLPIYHQSNINFNLPAKYAIASLPPPPPDKGPRAPATRTINTSRQRKTQPQIPDDQATLDNFITKHQASTPTGDISETQLPSTSTSNKKYNFRPRVRLKYKGSNLTNLINLDIESKDKTDERLDLKYDTK